MKITLTLTSCLAVASLALAADQDNNNKKNKNQGQGAQGAAQVQAQPHQKTFTPKGQQHFNAVNPNAAQLHTNKTTFNPNNAVLNKKTNKTTLNNQAVNNANVNNAVINKKTLNKTTLNNQAVVNKKTLNKTTVNNTTINNTTFNKKVFKGQQFNLQNKPNPKIAAVKFNANYHIPGSQKWKGNPKYAVFVNYQPAWHNSFWWHQHHSNIIFVFGGWYFWDAGYYCPAWGYAPNAYYAYDGPIYVGAPETDPGQVVANVQSALQQQGYYQGEIDGILGPQTRGALADYQVAQGLEPTGAVDEPTLELLGLA
jgi:hypothetical protein